MKRHIRVITGAFLIVIFAMNVLMPLRAQADPDGVTIQGQVTFKPRNWVPIWNNWAFGNELRIELWKDNPIGFDQKLASTYTSKEGGYFEFTNISSQINVYLNVVTEYSINFNPTTATTNRLSTHYSFDNSDNPTFLSSDGLWTINFAIDEQEENYQALWIFEDLRNAWNYVHDNYYVEGEPYDPGYINAIWEFGLDGWPLELPDWIYPNQGSFTYGGDLPHFIFIAGSDNINSMDIVAHEAGHMFMINANGFWYTGCTTHYVFTASDEKCAYTEGWADVLPLFVNGDQCYDKSAINPCQGEPDVSYYNLEVHSRIDNDPKFQRGDQVEGRVAGALYDLFDDNNEGTDMIYTDFGPIAHIVLGRTQYETFSDYWGSWIGTHPQTIATAGFTLWWNTINYANIQQTYLPIIKK